MRKKLRVVSAAGLIIVGAMLLLTPNARVSANRESLESSRSLYRQHCASCHGANGKAQTPKGIETEADDLTSSSVKSSSRERLIRIITNGKGDMPGFKKKLSASQIASITTYIRSL